MLSLTSYKKNFPQMARVFFSTTHNRRVVKLFCFSQHKINSTAQHCVQRSGAQEFNNVIIDSLCKVPIGIGICEVNILLKKKKNYASLSLTALISPRLVVVYTQMRP